MSPVIGFETPNTFNIVLIQSCSTDLDCQGRITGSLDMPLSESGVVDAKKIADTLQNVDLLKIIAANCAAALQTAQALSRHGQIRVRVEENLTNLDHGLWHGKSLKELKGTQPKLFRKWRENPDAICPPGGETMEQVRVRVAAVLKKISRKAKAGTIAIVAPEPLLGIIRSEIERADNCEIQSLVESDSHRPETTFASHGAV